MKFSDNFKTIWWAILFLGITFYLYSRHDILIQGKPNYFDVVVFLVWIAVALAPIFKDMKLFGLHLKQDIDDLKKDLSYQLSMMKIELQSSIEVSSSNSNNVHINSAPMSPAPDSKLPDIKRMIDDILEKQGLKNTDKSKSDTRSWVGVDISQSNVELFKVRLSFETLLNNYMRMNSNIDRFQPITKIISMLSSNNIISTELANSIKEIMAICNYGIHGEEISSKQLELVGNSSYGLYEALKQALR